MEVQPGVEFASLMLPFSLLLLGLSLSPAMRGQDARSLKIWGDGEPADAEVSELGLSISSTAIPTLRIYNFGQWLEETDPVLSESNLRVPIPKDKVFINNHNQHPPTTL